MNTLTKVGIVTLSVLGIIVIPFIVMLIFFVAYLYFTLE